MKRMILGFVGGIVVILIMCLVALAITIHVVDWPLESQDDYKQATSLLLHSLEHYT